MPSDLQAGSEGDTKAGWDQCISEAALTGERCTRKEPGRKKMRSGPVGRGRNEKGAGTSANSLICWKQEWWEFFPFNLELH